MIENRCTVNVSAKLILNTCDTHMREDRAYRPMIVVLGNSSYKSGSIVICSLYHPSPILSKSMLFILWKQSQPYKAKYLDKPYYRKLQWYL